MNLIFNKKTNALLAQPCPALHQVDIKDLDKQSLFQYNYHISQLWGFTRPRHFRLINKPLTNLNSSAMTHPALALQFNGKMTKTKASHCIISRPITVQCMYIFCRKTDPEQIHMKPFRQPKQCMKSQLGPQAS